MSWHLLSEEEKHQVQERFTALSAVDHIRHQMQDDLRERCYGFGDLYQFASNINVKMTPGLQQALQQDNKLKAALDQLLSESVIYQFPRAAAAGSGDLESRTGDGFSIQIKESRARNGQVYIIVKMEDAFQPEPTAIIVKSAKGQYLKEKLPHAVDGVFQFLLEAEDKFVQILRDAGTEVSLSA